MSDSLRVIGDAVSIAGGLPGPAPAGVRPRLLLVDDDLRLGRSMADIARECGYDTSVAISAGGFRAAYETEAPSVVLLDLSLPGGDGVELLRFLAEKQSRSLILIVSGFDKRVVEAASRLGEELGLTMGECLTKPIPVHQLKEAIDRSFRRLESSGGGEYARRSCLT